MISILINKQKYNDNITYCTVINKKHSFTYPSVERGYHRGRIIPSLHAEENLLNNSNNCKKILITRFNKLGQPCYSRPCNNCIDMLINNNVKYVYYFDINGNLTKELVKKMKLMHISRGYKLLLDSYK